MRKFSRLAREGPPPERYIFECLRCGHKWFARLRKGPNPLPACCPWCLTNAWQTPEKE